VDRRDLKTLERIRALLSEARAHDGDLASWLSRRTAAQRKGEQIAAHRRPRAFFATRTWKFLRRLFFPRGNPMHLGFEMVDKSSSLHVDSRQIGQSE
jgi:hypothetical protein